MKFKLISLLAIACSCVLGMNPYQEVSQKHDESQNTEYRRYLQERGLREDENTEFAITLRPGVHVLLYGIDIPQIDTSKIQDLQNWSEERQKLWDSFHACTTRAELFYSNRNECQECKVVRLERNPESWGIDYTKCWENDACILQRVRDPFYEIITQEDCDAHQQMQCHPESDEEGELPLQWIVHPPELCKKVPLHYFYKKYTPKWK